MLSAVFKTETILSEITTLAQQSLGFSLSQCFLTACFTVLLCKHPVTMDMCIPLVAIPVSYISHLSLVYHGPPFPILSKTVWAPDTHLVCRDPGCYPSITPWKPGIKDIWKLGSVRVDWWLGAIPSCVYLPCVKGTVLNWEASITWSLFGMPCFPS